LILVNNASTDDSENIIYKTISEKFPIPWKIIKEIKPGLAHARLCGLTHAQFDLLLYCDDDNWLSPDYVNKGEQFLRIHPEVAILGGKGAAVSSVAIPGWFESVQNHYAVGPQLPQSGRVKGIRNMVYGAGMFIRKEAFDHLLACGFRFQSLGRTGKNLSAGEDSELCLAMQIAGKQIWYLEDLSFQHYMEPFRLRKGYFKKMRKGMSDSGFYGRFYRDYLFGYRPDVTRHFWMKELIYTVFDILKTLPKMNFNIRRHVRLILLLLTEQDKYNHKVLQILETCEKLKNKK
jgi:glycosyltransferase involved in cell wall biosynthesis